MKEVQCANAGDKVAQEKNTELVSLWLVPETLEGSKE